MKETLISFECAKLAKKKGFDWKCYASYSSKGKDLENTLLFALIDLFHATEEDDRTDMYSYNADKKSTRYDAPTQSLLLKWIREKYKLNIEVWYNFTRQHWEFSIFDLTKTRDSKNRKINVLDTITYSDTYEQVLEQGLIQGLKLIENEEQPD